MCLGAVVSHSLKGVEITAHAHAHCGVFALSVHLLYFQTLVFLKGKNTRGSS